jgi:hypothetical protein
MRDVAMLKVRLFSLILFATVFVGTFLLPASAQAQDGDNCAWATATGFECSDGAGCSRRIVLRVCAGNTSPQCCVSTGTFVTCCGDSYQNDVNVGKCGTAQCSEGGLVVEPGTGKMTRECFGTKAKSAQAKETPPGKIKPTTQETTRASRR